MKERMDCEWIVKQIASYLTQKERYILQSVSISCRDIIPSVSPIFVIRQDDFIFKFVANKTGYDLCYFNIKNIENKNLTYVFCLSNKPKLDVVIDHNIDYFQGEIVVVAKL